MTTRYKFPLATFALTISAFVALTLSAQAANAQNPPTPTPAVQTKQTATPQAQTALPQPYKVAVPNTNNQQSAKDLQSVRPRQSIQAQQSQQRLPLGAQVQGRPLTRMIASPNQQIIGELNNLLNDQAARGQFPANNAFLADVENLIRKYTVFPKSKIKVTNSGPGVLKIKFVNGTFVDLNPNFQVDLEVGRPQIQLEAMFQNVSIELKNTASNPARFWDQDDRQYHKLKSNGIGVVQPHRAILTPGTIGHHLEQ